MERIKIGEGIHFTAIEGDYRRSRLSVYVSAPLSRKTQTATALLPYMLERGTKSLPDMTLIKRRLNMLYGSSLNTAYSQYGFARTLECGMSGADGSLVDASERLDECRAELLCELLTQPNIENGGFRADWLDIEREKLRDTIRSIINDKRDYCFRLLCERFYEKDERSLACDGYESDLESISGETLYEVYREMLQNSSVEIISVGPSAGDKLGAARMIASAIAPNGAPIRPLTAVEKTPEAVIEKRMDVEQDKLALAFTSGALMDIRQLAALRMANAILGATPTSRLFMNVREKKSLCYSVNSGVSYECGGGMFIECGTDAGASDTAKAAILAEFETLRDKGPSEKELKETLLVFENALSSVYDSSYAMNAYAISSIQRYGDILTPDFQLETLRTITAKEVCDALASLSLSVSCTVGAKEAAK